jgi:hypothetical protein
MPTRSCFRGFLLVAAIVLLSPDILFAWGPATHIKLAGDILSQLHLLSPALAALLARHARDFLFGNIAADVVFAKRLSRIKQYCHRWDTAFAIADAAETDRARAFAAGYLAHLAADTVAHNKFLPHQMTVTSSTLSFGHLYWEMRADASIGTHYWDQLRNVLQDPQRFDEHEYVLAQKLTDTLLPFEWNRAIFYRINKTFSSNGLMRTLDVWYHRSRWPLDDDMLVQYRVECVERALDLLNYGRRSAVLCDDPNGTASLSHTRARRKLHRRMARAGILAPHVIAEAVARHAPTVRNGPLLTAPLTPGQMTQSDASSGTSDSGGSDGPGASDGPDGAEGPPEGGGTARIGRSTNVRLPNGSPSADSEIS